MDRLRFIPDPHAQERYLQGAVAAVLSQAHGRILRMLQQADMFKNITSKEGLLKVRPTAACSFITQGMATPDLLSLVVSWGTFVQKPACRRFASGKRF